MDWQRDIVAPTQNWGVFAPDSPELVERLGAWHTRRGRYADKLTGLDRLPASDFPFASVIVDLQNPEYIQPSAWYAFAGQDKIQLIVLRRDTGPIPFQIMAGLADTALRIAPECTTGTAKNLGSLFADAPILIFLADYLAPAPDIASAFMECLAQGAMAARGKIVLRDPGQDQWQYNLGDVSFPHPIDKDENLAITKEAFMKAGGFDEALPRHFLGADLGLRLEAINHGGLSQYYCGNAKATFPNFYHFLYGDPPDAQLFTAKYDSIVPADFIASQKDMANSW